MASDREESHTGIWPGMPPTGASHMNALSASRTLACFGFRIRRPAQLILPGRKVFTDAFASGGIRYSEIAQGGANLT